jgi:hypothetical protein
MAVYGVTQYGTETYGYFIPPVYRVDPFVAEPYNYESIQITWNQPSGAILAWRLIKNMYGCPVDQDDGQILIDSTAIPVNGNTDFPNGSGAGWVGYEGTFSVSSNPPPGTPYPYAGEYVNNGTNVGAMEESSAMFSSVQGNEYTLMALIYSSVSSVQIGFDWFLNGTYSSTTTSNITVQPDTWTPIIVSKESSGNTGYARLGFSTANGATLYVQNIVVTAQQAVGYVGNSYTDTTITPGAYHYYGFYVQTNSATDTWVRSGLTACLMPNNYGSSDIMLNNIPELYVSTSGAANEIVTDDTGNPLLSLFIQVFGWGIDYIWTQYDSYQYVNDPWKIPLNDLYNLAGELNININPDIHPYTLRKAIYYNANVNQFRGSVTGLTTELSALTGWDADVTIGPNLLLNNDQSYFADPMPLPWSANIAYNVNETVTYENYMYECIATGNEGTSPTGTTSSNTYWEAILDVHNNTYLVNSATGNPSTWEVLYPDLTNGQPAANSIYEVYGIAEPLFPSNFVYNGLGATNLNGSTTDIWLRSVSRTTVDLETVTTTFAPDKFQAMADGIPVPNSSAVQEWSSTTTYATQDVVFYNNQPFIALRASLNSIPPYTDIGIATQDWAPLGMDQRYRIATSCYQTASGNGTQVTPFIEWYDGGGNYINRVFARNPSNSGAQNLPGDLVYDSFTVGAGDSISSRTTDDGGYTWDVQTGSFTVSPYDSGCVYNTTASQRSIATVSSGTANGQVGLTFVTTPESGQSIGLVLRWQSDTSYLRADASTLKENNGGTFTTLGTYSTPFSNGDRMIVQLNGTTITVLRNGSQVLQVTSSFNETSTTHGIINENT